MSITNEDWGNAEEGQRLKIRLEIQKDTDRHQYDMRKKYVTLWLTTLSIVVIFIGCVAEVIWNQAGLRVGASEALKGVLFLALGFLFSKQIEA